MAKIYNLSEFLEEKKAKIILGEVEIEIKDGFNDLLKIDALSNRREELGDMEFVGEFLKISLGEEESTALISKNYSVKIYTKIMKAIQEVYSGQESADPSIKEV